MTINQLTLQDLYARLAAGDGDARRDFDRHVLPLMEIVVGRWLWQRSSDAAETQPLTPAGEQPSETASAEGLRRISGAICARLAARSGRSRRPRDVRSAGAAPAPETIVGD